MACKPPVSWSNPRSVAELAEPLRSIVAQVIRDCPIRTKASTGVALSLWLNSGKRTDYMQWLLRHQRVPAGQECNPAYPGVPTTAVPGRSRHRNLGPSICAADLAGSGLGWLARHEGEYGLHRPVSGERWHFQPIGTPTRKITPYGAVPEVPDVWKDFHAGDTDIIVEARGGFKHEVSETQLRLKILSKSWADTALDPGMYDGVYGLRSQRSVSHFKARIIAIQKSGGKTPWPNTDSNVGKKTIDMLRWWTA